VPTKKANASAVSNLLTDASFERSARGTAGFHARAEGPRVIVSWRPAASLLYPPPGQRQRDKATAVEMAAKYAEVLGNAGRTTRVDEGTVYVLPAEEDQQDATTAAGEGNG